MDITPNTTAPPEIPPQAVADAEQIVAHIEALEASPAFAWLRGNLEGTRDDLKDRVLHDEALSPEMRERVRFGYLTLKQCLDNIERTMQTQLNILRQANKLTARQLQRLIISTAPTKPSSEVESLSPFAQVAMDMAQLFGTPTTPPS